MRALVCLLLLLVSSPALALPDLIHWRHQDTTGIWGWRLYVQTEFETMATIIDIPLSEATPHPEGVYGRFIDRDPDVHTYVTVVAVDDAGAETEAQWSRVLRPFHGDATCRMDYDRSGFIGLTDWSIFIQAYGRPCDL